MRSRAILLLTFAAALVGIVPASAQASTGTYQVTACNAAPGAVNNSWMWSTSDTADPAHYSEYEECPYRTGGDGGSTDQQSGLSTTDALGLSDGAAPGTSAGWTFVAPPGTTIAGISYERYIGHVDDPSNSWVPALRADGVVVPGESCLDSVQNGETCIVGGPPGEGDSPGAVTGLSAHELSLSIVCEAPSGEECVTGATKHAAWAAMYGATVTLSDTTPPTLGTPTGPLWEAGEFDDDHKGSESVTVEAQDVGGGVQSIVLSADGTPVETDTAACNFTYAQPCPNSTGPQTLTLPTSELTDGTHTLTLAAIDAAGNESTLASEQITIDNTPPSAPLDLAATPTQTGSSTFTATWTDPPSQVAPITEATYQLCPASGPGACSAATDAPAAGPASITVPGPGTWTLTVWLTNAAGNSDPANAAYVTLTVPKPTRSGEGSQPNGNGSSGQTGGETGQSGSAGSGGSDGSLGQSGKSGKGSTSPKVKVHLQARARSRKLIVLLGRKGGGRVRVSYKARYHGRQIASRSQTVTLRHGKRTITFKLTAETATRATIRVSAKVAGEAAVTSTLPRRANSIGPTRRLMMVTQVVIPAL